MYSIRKTKDFEKSYKNIQRSGRLVDGIQTDLENVIDSLKEKKSLPEKFKDHQLKGKLKEYRECHIRSDILLIYRMLKEELILILIDIGSHSQIFK